MKKLLLLILLNVVVFAAFSQPHTNTWINYNQEYYKIKVWQDGLNRITQQTLLFAGFSPAGIDPRKIQLFHNGVEQYIYIQGENDGTFDANDFIEFYGQHNDGSFDKKMYADTVNWQPTPNYSLITDTSVYFLTYNLTTNGKRLSLLTDTTYNSFTASPYFIKDSYLEGKDLNNPGIFGYNRGFNSESIDYTEGEGWGSVFGNYGGGNYGLTINVPTNKIYSSGPNADISFCIGGVNNPPHNLIVTFPGINLTDLYYNQKLNHYSYSLSPGLFSAATTPLVLNVTTPVAETDYSMFYWFSMKYPHTYDLEGQNTFKLLVPDDLSQAKTRMDITNFSNGGSIPILYDLTNHRRIEIVQNGSTFYALVDNDASAQPKECFLSAQNAISTPSVSKINYNTANFGHFNDFGTLNVDSAFIIITHRSLWSEGQSYQNYRNLHAPNIGRTVLVDIDELYDQFAYGIQKHPLSIRNFSHYILDTWPTEAQHMLLIGKSINSFDFRLNPALFGMCAVPSYGVPTSDILLTSGINGSQWEPKIPIGRISAQNGNDVNSYLDKVTEYDSAQNDPNGPAPWMKEILHFGGGNDDTQQQILAGYLDQYKVILEDSLFGGHVTTYLKNSTDPIVINVSQALKTQIDTGVAIMTFFGHASGSSFDNSTDNPETYNNRGRYPVIVANSCFAGDFHTYSRSISERFILTPEKAAIGFLASVGLGNPSYLLEYTDSFFKNASYTNYGATIGQLMKKAIQEIQVTNAEGEKQVSQDMCFQGDPSIRFNTFTKPDYAINESNIHFTPTTITSDLDTFSVRITTRNLGKAKQDSFIVKVRHTFPNGVDSVYQFKRGRCYYSDDLNITMNTGAFNGAGVNRISVDVDLPDSVDEYDNYFNNSTSSDFFIISKDIIPVYPPDYAIHPYNTVTLKASTANPMTGMASYTFQIDTIDLNLKDATPGMQTSPMFRFSNVTDSGGVLSWSPSNYVLGDSVVYFWRVANDSIQYDTVNFHWQQSSFMYIPGKTGWAQSHFHQFKNDNYENVRYDTLGRKFDFVFNNKSLRIFTMGTPAGLTEYNEIGYYINNSVVEDNGCDVFPAIMVAVLDSISLKPWTTCEYNFGQLNTYTLTGGTCDNPQSGSTGSCRARPENYFIFRYGTPAYMTSLQSMINNVPAGNYILLYSWFTSAYSAADPALYSTLTSLGFNTALLQDNLPFEYFVRKGYPGTQQELHGNNQGDTLTLNTLIQSTWNRGNINSLILGPARRWESLHWKQHPREALPYKDIVHVNIYGLSSTTNHWDTLASGIQYNSGSDTSLSWISSTNYPYIKLQSYVQDDSLRTPPQMDYWRVYYDEVPECAVNPNRSFFFHANPLQEGDTVRMSIAIENISNLPMDSLGVSFYIYDNRRTKHLLPIMKLDSLRINQSLIASLVIDTTFGYAGENSIWVEANPFNDSTYHHQPEKYHFNNFAEMKFNIEADRTNPILDVTFDGVHILNNDIVSGKPQIAIQLHDENRFLALNDTTKFQIYITPPNAVVSQQIPWNLPMYSKALQFTPAQLPKNSCRIDWNPTLTEDGIYTIEVAAADRSNNVSGRYNYKISFEVINRSTITEVLNYPNPFSTSTRFVFTLTGSEVPTGMKIQIMTVTGKIVREIMQNELGNIHVGRNITDYAWDGRDEFGDQLANGLYLYHVITDMHGESIEHRDTDIDKYFKKGWGKMYLMR